MKRVTVESCECVRIALKGEKVRESPIIPNDHGLVKELSDWLFKEKIYRVHGSGGRSGGGVFIEYFEPEDAERVLIWIEEHNETGIA